MQNAERRKQRVFTLFLPTANCQLPTPPVRGMSLLEALFGSALMMIIFLGIFGAYKLAIDLVFSTRAASGASALINDRVEYIRGLSYDAIGTSGGIPSGVIPQSESIPLNGVSYTLSTLIQYVDDPADGLDAADSNQITADYKSVRVSATWSIRDRLRSAFVLTRISPTGIETLASGGTLKVNVFDIAAAPVSGATVRIVNAETSPAIDVTSTTGTDGTVWFPGAPPASGYQISVSKSGHSSAQTYSATTQNPNPNPGHVAVADRTTTTLSLEINPTGSLAISTFSPAGPGAFTDTFANQSSLSGTVDTAVSDGSLHLAGAVGSYPATGSASSIAISPQNLSSWDSLSFTASTSPEAFASVSLYYWNGTAYVLVPDSALSGNSAGFAASPVDVSGVSASTYGTLQIAGNFSSSDPLWTPEILEWNLSYVAGPTPLPNVDFLIHGTKNIGISQGGSPIYKVDGSYTTNSYGEWLLTPLETDGYTISLPSSSPYVISELCPASVSIAPAQSATVSIIASDATSDSLRVVVAGSGNPLQGATVTLQGGSVNEQVTTSACGQAFFGGISAGTYTVTVSRAGYQTSIDSNVQVMGSAVYSATLIP